ncbi:MAG: NAD(P)H-hydrate dehydratase [Bacteroidota bacterium]
MKIFSIDKIREADAFTIDKEPIASIDLMERASLQLFSWIQKHVKSNKKIHIFAGLGNNGGDGLSIGRMLAKDGYKVTINILRYSKNTSSDFQVNFSRLADLSGIEINEIENAKAVPQIGVDDVVVDAIFGSGLTRPIKGFIADVITSINNSTAITISVDIPSGLFADETSLSVKGEIIKADYTLSFQFPKLAFLLPENEMYVGNWEILDIGLSNEYIHSTSTKNHLILKDDIIPVLKGRAKFSHKGTYGHALLIAGCYGKMGAAILASKACLRSGVGLLHTHVPKSGVQILQTATPETMVSIDRYDNYFSQAPNIGLFNAIGIGPGLGMEHQSQMAMKLLIQNSPCPMVFDADALNILAENPTWLAFLPKGSILTPHPKEFNRLAGSWQNDFERLDKQRNLAQKHGIYIVLKGAHTSICFPDGQCYFNSTGNPGMATAGSGDVLTGIITGLLASGYTSGIAAILGVYLHGLAGDIASNKNGIEALIAGDIIDNIGNTFMELHTSHK